MKATNKEIEAKKKAFANNPDYEGKSAQELALKAALQYGRIYSPNTSFRKKNEFRQAWMTKLIELGNKYKTEKQSEEQFKNDIRDLKESLNTDSFINILNNNSQNLGYEPGFRLGHAQKSFSIYLKHLWTRGELKYVPPVCPIDGVILKFIHNYDAWTKVNSFEDKDEKGNIIRGYNTHLRLVKEAAKQEGYSEIAEWELMKWEPNNTKDKKRNERGKKKENNNKKDGIQSQLETDNKIRGGRIVEFGYKIRLEGKEYYLFVGHTKTFKYCELLTNKRRELISECPKYEDLKNLGFEIEGSDYIYHRLSNEEYETKESYFNSILQLILEENA